MLYLMRFLNFWNEIVLSEKDQKRFGTTWDFYSGVGKIASKENNYKEFEGGWLLSVMVQLCPTSSINWLSRVCHLLEEKYNCYFKPQNCLWPLLALKEWHKKFSGIDYLLFSKTFCLWYKGKAPKHSSRARLSYEIVTQATYMSHICHF